MASLGLNELMHVPRFLGLIEAYSQSLTHGNNDEKLTPSRVYCRLIRSCTRISTKISDKTRCRLPPINYLWTSIQFHAGKGLVCYTAGRKQLVAGKSIFTDVIHQWRSPMRQFARARTIGEYDVTMPVPRVRATSHIELWWRHTVLSEKTVLGENL